ncbi:MAG: aminotransferase class V-fold PLP-dependent enzyme, partial [Proteobacteria bacterium]|nr:aminotransferase class V-fold PLP-dependent enzyme [Pseudomonadota bacterium]
MGDPKTTIQYANPLYGDEEIEAVVDALRTTDQLQVGPRVREMERRVAALFDKKYGVMTNSGTSALYLAVELLDLPKGSEILTSVVSFSATFAPIVRGGHVAAYVDVEYDTYNIDVDRIEEMVTPDTRAMLIPNLIGNAPDWERIREIADRHGLKVIEDSADTLGAELRGKTTGTWTDISMTSFAASHIITSGGSGGLVAVNTQEEWDRALLLRRWGRSSEVQMFGSAAKRSDASGSSSESGAGQGFGERFEAEIDGIPYDTMFIFDEVGWNFEPSEMHAAFGLDQLGKLEQFYQARKRRFELHTAFFNQRHILERFIPPRQLEGLKTSWISYPVMVREQAGFSRQELQRFLESRGIATRMVWSGNILRQPAFRNTPHRAAPGGYPNADRIMRQGL